MNVDLSSSIKTLGCLFPQLKNSEIGSIKIFPKLRSSSSVIQIATFLPPQQNRNHWNDRPPGAGIKYLIMHYTVANFPRTVRIFTEDKPTGDVSAHYVVTREEKSCGVPAGFILNVVPEEKRAWHAGVSSWGGQSDLNDVSIGIENVNAGFTETGKSPLQWFPFDPDQVRALGRLARSIVNKYAIDPTQVLGHEDIAFERKEDPGILFPWRELYTQYGIGAWLEDEFIENPDLIAQNFSPQEPLPEVYCEDFFKKYLEIYGYALQHIDAETGLAKDRTAEAIRSFKAHFSANQRPEAYETPAGKKEMIWAWGLCAKYGKGK